MAAMASQTAGLTSGAVLRRSAGAAESLSWAASQAAPVSSTRAVAVARGQQQKKALSVRAATAVKEPEGFQVLSLSLGPDSCFHFTSCPLLFSRHERNDCTVAARNVIFSAVASSAPPSCCAQLPQLHVSSWFHDHMLQVSLKSTKPIDGQKTGTSGLRKKVRNMCRLHFLASWQGGGK